jgi:hypothetical protein
MKLIGMLVAAALLGACGPDEPAGICEAGATRCGVDGTQQAVEKCSDPYSTGTLGWHLWDTCGYPGPYACAQCSATVARCVQLTCN